MNFFKKPGRILLTIILCIAILCSSQVHMYKTKIEYLQSGKLKVDSMYMPADLHPESTYLMAIPYIIIEVTLLCANKRQLVFYNFN